MNPTAPRYLRKILPAIFLTALLCTAQKGWAQADSSVYYSQKVSVNEMRKDIDFLTSPELEGRAFGSAGLAVAGRYIQNRLRKMGLRPLRNDFGSLSYNQPFLLYSDTVLPKLKIGRTTYLFGNGFHTFSAVGKTLKAKKLVFVGDNSSTWDQKPERIKDQIIVLVPGYNTDSSATAVKACIEKAAQMQAKAMLIPSIKFGQYDTLADPEIQRAMRYENVLAMDPGLNAFNDRFPESIRQDSENKMPVIFINWQVVRGILSQQELQELLKDFHDTDLSKYDKNVSFKLSQGKTTIGHVVNNVVGYVQGRTEMHILVVGAHYDHLGSDSTGFYPGADDNASGVASMLQVAKILNEAAKNGHQPERSIVFVAFSGDEGDLFGSSNFEESFADSRIIVDAMLNIDMVGRRDTFRMDTSAYLYVLGWDLDPKVWADISKSTQKKMPGFNPDYSITDKNDPEGLLFSSAQYSFLANGIPALYFYDGMSTDYHQTTDTPDKIDWNLLDERTRFIFLTAWEAAFKTNW